MNKQIRTGVIGVGNMGQHHARIYASLPGSTLIGVADTDVARAERRAATNQDLANVPVIRRFEGAIRIDRAWHLVVGQQSPWSDEDAVLQGCAVIDKSPVLQLAVVADSHTEINVNPFAEDAIAADGDILTHLCLVPDL